MTTHEALQLQPNTLVHHLPPKGHNVRGIDGVATPQHPQQIRVRWNAIGEVDSIVSVLDRILLSSIELDTPLAEQDLGKRPV